VNDPGSPSGQNGNGGKTRGDGDLVAQAFYARQINLPEIARSRAQAGFGVATLLATGLIAAGILSEFPSLSLLVQISGIVTVSLWVLASIIFLWAIAIPVKVDEREQGEQRESVFVSTTLNDSLDLYDKITWRSKVAALAAIAAIVLSLISFVLVVTVPRPDPRNTAADVVLTGGAFRLVSDACPRAVISMKPPAVIADINPNSLNASRISLRLGPAQCRGVSNESIDLPRADILAIAVHSACSLQLSSAPISLISPSDASKYDAAGNAPFAGPARNRASPFATADLGTRISRNGARAGNVAKYLTAARDPSPKPSLPQASTPTPKPPDEKWYILPRSPCHGA
jgi:hypothetical protein